MARRAAICQLDIVLEAVRGRVAVDLLCDGKHVGELTAYDVEPETLRRRCRRALDLLSRSVGTRLTPYVVHWSKLPARLRGTGVGTAMYLAAAEGASRLGGALIQHACFHDPEGDPGTTSKLAKNVWKGARFRRRVAHRDGVVAYMPSQHWGAGAAMLRFDQLEIDRNSLSQNPKAELRELGDALRKTLDTPAAYRLIDRHPEIEGTTWLSGSCMVLAVALKRWYPGFRFAGVAQGDLVHHVLVAYDKLYFDADGASTKAQLQARWRDVELLPNARVIWLDTPERAAVVDSNGQKIACPRAAVDDVHAYLRRELGRPVHWGLPPVANPTPFPGATPYCDDAQGARLCRVGHGSAVSVQELLALESF